jgi:WD40 repeat protein
MVRSIACFVALVCVTVSISNSPDVRADENGEPTPVRVLSPPMPLPERDYSLPLGPKAGTPQDDFFCLAFSSDGASFAAGGSHLRNSNDGTTVPIVKIWSLGTKGIETTHEVNGVDDGFATSLLFLPSRNELAIGGTAEDATAEGFLQFWDVSTRREKNRIRYGKLAVASLAISADAKWLAVGTDSAQGQIRIWDIPKNEEAATLVGHRDRVTSLAFSPNGAFLLSSGCDATIRVWDTATWHVARECKSKGQRAIMAVSPSAKDRIAAVTGGNVMNGIGNDDVCIWNYQTGERIRTLEGHIQAIASIAFSPDGKLLVTGGTTTIVMDGKAQIRDLGDASAQFLVWDVRCGRVLSSIRGHVGEVRAIAFSPSGELFGTVDSIGRAIRLWASPRPLAASSAIR